jgi:hypothetical protein
MFRGRYKQSFIKFQHPLESTKRMVSMKTGYKCFWGIICLLLLLGPASISAKCKCGKPPKENHLEEKIYLSASQIDIVENQIYANLESEAIPVLTLHTDQEGIYVLVRRRQGRCPEGYWECDTCSGCTSLYNWDCDWCGDHD